MISNNRRAFSLLVAIFVMVIMSSVSILVMSLSSKILQNTTAQYQREQAILLAKSYTEYAIMAIMSNDRVNTTCLDKIEAEVGESGSSDRGEGYRVRVSIAYIGDANVAGCTNVLSSAVTTPQSPLNVLINVYVDYKDINNPNISNSQWITYHRRTLQKI